MEYRVGKSRRCTGSLSKWCSKAGAKWEVCPEPGGPARSKRGRYAMGCRRTDLMTDDSPVSFVRIRYTMNTDRQPHHHLQGHVTAQAGFFPAFFFFFLAGVQQYLQRQKLISLYSIPHESYRKISYMYFFSSWQAITSMSHPPPPKKYRPLLWN